MKTYVCISCAYLQDIIKFLTSIKADYQYKSTLWYIKTDVVIEDMYHPFSTIMEITI
jgi:hypothetical protein